jgi:hypothetical protein
MRDGSRPNDRMETENLNSTIAREPGGAEIDLSLELPTEVLLAIRSHGVYDEVAIDPTSGRVLARVHLTGHYDSYSDTYEINGTRWKVEGHKSWSRGEDTYTMKLEEEHDQSRR